MTEKLNNPKLNNHSYFKSALRGGTISATLRDMLWSLDTEQSSSKERIPIMFIYYVLLLE